MAAAMQTSKCSIRTSVQSRSPAPFRAASQAVPHSRRMIVTKAAQVLIVAGFRAPIRTR